MPHHKGRPPGSSLKISESSSEEVSTDPDPESEEDVDQLESDIEDSDNRHMASSSGAARASSPSASSSSSVPLSKRKATPKMRRPRDGRGRYTTSRSRSNPNPTYTSRAKPSLRISKETPTHIAESSTDLARHEHVMKELGSIQSRLDIIHDSIKTILPTRRKLTENKENEPATRESTKRNAFPHEAPLKQVQDKAHAGITRPTRALLSDHSQTVPSSSNIDGRHPDRQTPMSGTVNPKLINEGFVTPTTGTDQRSLNTGFRFSVGGHSDSDHPPLTPPECLLPPIAAIEELPEARSSTRSP
ncbi:hypothetical protein AN958_08427 [Leucoagaricus sp. SymC.cos]|nr:hypothetical protein AN958_08427 [Leucoagaricus sp. SymC.cos]